MLAAGAVPLLLLLLAMVLQLGRPTLVTAAMDPSPALPPVEMNPSVMVVGSFDWGDRWVRPVGTAAGCNDLTGPTGSVGFGPGARHTTQGVGIVALPMMTLT